MSIFSLQILVLTSAIKKQHLFQHCTLHSHHTCNEVIEAACPSRTAKGAQVCKHQTLIVLSQEPAAIMVFS